MAVIEAFGPEYWDEVAAAQLPFTRLRFRYDPLLGPLGLEPAYGRFEGRDFLYGWDVGYGVFFAGLADRTCWGGLPATAEEL